MEKKTLGAFIAVLRKSRGMTQRELAEKLGVSDKTISHWERDESAPDISVIPVIAEIFDVTCDELLKGEKAKDTNEITPKANPKQLRYIFEKSYTKFRTQCLILVGIALAGFVFSFLAYWEWAWNFFLIDLIFFIGSVFGLLICKNQNKTAVYTEEINEELTEKYQKKSREIFWYSILTNVLLVFFSVESVGFIIAPVTTCLLYLILRLTKQITFEEKGKIIEKNIIKTVAVVLALSMAFSVCFFELPEIITKSNTPEPMQFENTEQLKSFMETEKPFPEYASGERDANVCYEVDFVDGEYVWKCYDDFEDTVLVEFVWRNNEIQNIEFYYTEDGRFDVAIIYFYENNIAEKFVQSAEPLFYAFYPAVIISAALICVFKTRKQLKSK